MQSALYFGTVRHRRFATADSPRAHRLAYPLFQLYADLDELDRIFRGSWLASAKRPAWAWLRRRDYFGDPARPWADGVRDAVAERLGRRPAGAVRLLTHPRTAGFRMNPVSFYFLFDAAGELDAVLAEVTNTPWDERHLYAVDARAGRRGAHVEARLSKRFHVSPFFPMELDYRWRLTPPGARLAVHMESFRGGEKLFDATLSLARRPLDPRQLRRALLGYPFLTLKVFLWIYLHAAWLKLRGVRFHPHPKRRAAPALATASPPASPGGSSSAG